MDQQGEYKKQQSKSKQSTDAPIQMTYVFERMASKKHINRTATENLEEKSEINQMRESIIRNMSPKSSKKATTTGATKKLEFILPKKAKGSLTKFRKAKASDNSASLSNIEAYSFLSFF